MATRDGTRGRDQDIPNDGVPGASSVGAPIARKGTPESSAFGDGVLQLDHLVDEAGVQPSRGIMFVVCQECGGAMPARPVALDDPCNGATSHGVCEACQPAYEAQIREAEAYPLGIEGEAPEDLDEEEEGPAPDGDPHCEHEWPPLETSGALRCYKCGADGDA